MEFPYCKVKSVKADIANGDLTISFKMAINDVNMETAEALGLYVDKDQGEVELRIIPRQTPLFTASLIGMEPAEQHLVKDLETGEITEEDDGNGRK